MDKVSAGVYRIEYTKSNRIWLNGAESKTARTKDTSKWKKRVCQFNLHKSPQFRKLMTLPNE